MLSKCIKLYLSVLQTLQPAVDKFLWRTAEGEFSFHCPFPLQPVTHNEIYLVKREKAGAAVTAFDWTCELPARTSEFACCFWCNADRWCSSASHSDRFPASRTTSAGARNNHNNPVIYICFLSDATNVCVFV